MIKSRTREISIEVYGRNFDLQLEDDGYRIFATILRGGGGNTPNGMRVLWAEYKHCDLSFIGFGVADYLMVESVQSHAA